MALNSSFWSRCPLGAKLHSFLGSFDDSQYEGYGHEVENRAFEKWRREKGKSNLNLFIEVIGRADARALCFKDSLSDSQLTSWCLIDEWLRGSYQPGSCATAAWDAIQDDNFLHFELHDVEFALNPYETSQYQFHLLAVYVGEFVPFKPAWDPHYGAEPLTLLESRRHRAFKMAICQRLAHRMYVSKALGQKMSSCEDLSLTSAKRDFAHWLPKDQAQDEMPYYLWDTVEKKTIITHDLSDRPQYCCISHTWGRWREKGMARVSGLIWWKVPSNSVFIIERLPAILKDLADRMKTRYVWIDLLCIPQEDSTPELAAIAKEEISRQAVIFRNARHCAAWMNYIDDWSAEKAALDYISAVYLSLTTIAGQYREDILHDWIKGATEGAEYPTQLNDHPFHKKYFHPPRVPLFKKIGNLLRAEPRMSEKPERTWLEPTDWDRPSAWFSSLWTLQEACIRPDMIFMNRRWEPLTNSVGDSYTLEMLFISLETLAGLMKSIPSDRISETSSAVLDRIGTNWESRPMGLKQLNNLLFGTQLLSVTNRIHVLIQANARQCTGRRAEAIMSVLGTTEWYQQASADEELVLGMYPLAFVEEVRRKAGTDFFLAQKIVGDPQAAACYFDGSAHGSMLPFETLDPERLCGKADVKMYPYRAIDNHVHSSTQSWTLEGTGSFKITKAAILASSEDNSPAIIPVEVFLSYQTLPGNVTHTDRIEVKQWLMQQPQMFVTYAVQVSRELGVIFQSFRHHLHNFPPPLKLVKVGCYQIFDLPKQDPEDALTGDDWISKQPTDWVPAQDVNWIVL